MEPSALRAICRDPSLHFYLSLTAIIAFFIVLANTSAVLWPDDQDGVNYLLGIDRYDLIFHRPHFPGYPVYIAAGKLFATFSSSAERALIGLSIFSGAACLWLMAIMVRQMADCRTALLSTAALAVHPVFFEFSHKIFTEIPALSLLILAIVSLKDPVKASRIRWFFTALILGLMLGIRLSWWPFSLFYFVKGFRLAKGSIVFSGLLLGVFLWLIPQAALVGFEDLLYTGMSFVYGHFDQWGGAVGSDWVTENRWQLFARRGAEALGWIGSGTVFTRLPWTVFTLSGLLIILRRSNYPEAPIKTVITAGLFYLIWVVVGQNPEKVRHLLPLIPLFILVISPFIESHKKTATIVILIFSLTLPFDYAGRSQSTPPAVQFHHWTNALPLSDVEFYCGNSERLFDRYPSKHRIKNVPAIDNLPFTISSSWPTPVQRYVCDDIPGFVSTEEPIAVFTARKGDPVDRTLRLHKMMAIPTTR